MACPSSGVRFGIVALTLAVLLGACSDEKNPTPTSPPVTVRGPSFAAQISSSNFQQCANGDNGGVTCFYINGVLNDSKSLYHESEVIAERFVIPGLTPGQTYRLAFDYGWEKAQNPGHMNYDFLAKWDATLGELANPCGDPLGNTSADIRGVCNTDHTIKATHSGANASFQTIPDAIFTTNAPLGLSTELQASIDRFQTAHGADAARVDILGGSFPANAFDNVTYTVSGDDVKGRFTVRFTAGQTTVMLLWGGHFADIRDYNFAVWDADKNAGTPEVTGNLTGAAGQTGAPFQFSQVYLKNMAPGGDSTGLGSLSNNIQGSVLEPQPNASITIAATATNGIGEPHTFTVTLIKNLDNGAGDVPAAGEHVDVTLTPENGAVVQLDAAASTCDNAGANTDANGKCTMVFTSNSAGTVTGNATATMSLSGKTVSVSTNGNAPNSGPAIKTFVDGSIRWLKHNGSGQLLAGAVFTVCRTHVWDSDANGGVGGYTDITPDVCGDVTDNVSADNSNAFPADRDGTGGEFQLGGLILGKYTVQEKTAPTGYVLDPDLVTVNLSTTTTSFTIADAFVNRAPEAFITIGPQTATNDLNQSHTFTAIMTVDPDGGPAPVIGAITISVSPTPSTPGSTTCDDQVGPDPQTNLYSRTCRRTINSNVVGTFTANASASATVGTVTLTRDTDPATTTIGAGPGGSGPAVKNYVAPLLEITKTPDVVTDAGGEVHPGQSASFTITVRNNAAATTSATGVVMTDTLPARLTWTSNQSGKCTIDQVTLSEGSPPANVIHDRITCTIGSLAPDASFVVTVTSSIIPSDFLQLPPSNIGSGIEVDGNMVSDGGRDWVSLPSTVFSCVNPKVGCDVDLATGKNDNSFGQGTKEDTQDPTVVSGSIPNNKSDLRRFYVATERVGTANFLYLAWSRVQEPNGTTNMDFELNHGTAKFPDDGIPIRQAGDVLVRYDLAQGGTTPVLGFQRWITTGSPSNCEASNALPCWDKFKLFTSDVQGAINPQQIQEPFAGGNLSARTFGEASINLQAAGIFAVGTCDVFGQAYLKSRSSDAFNSELKDFILPIPVNITNCAPVTLNNKAWASATNFAPSGGNLGGGIFDTGKIEVTAQTASLDMGQSGELALNAFGAEPTTRFASPMGILNAIVPSEVQPASSFAGFATAFGNGELEQSPSSKFADDGVNTTRSTPRWRESTSHSPTTPLSSRSVPHGRVG